MQGTYANSGDRSTAHYLLNNTGTRGLHFSASAGYDSGRLQIEGIYSHFGEQTGVMFGAQMGSEDLLAERIRLGRPVYTDPFTRHISYPYQKVVHRTAIGKVRYNAGAAGVFYWQTSWQKDDRRENRIRRMNHSDIPAVALLLSSIQTTFRWKLRAMADRNRGTNDINRQSQQSRDGNRPRHSQLHRNAGRRVRHTEIPV